VRSTSTGRNDRNGGAARQPRRRLRRPIARRRTGPGRTAAPPHAADGRREAHRGITAGNALLARLARLGLVRWMSGHQRLVQVVESDMIGPSGPVTMLGVPVSDVVAIGNLAGNVALSIVAFSYAGRLNITVHADAYPGLPVLIAGIRHDWTLLDD
jgi:diacylglycerol O-acyltransferase